MLENLPLWPTVPSHLDHPLDSRPPPIFRDIAARRTRSK